MEIITGDDFDDIIREVVQEDEGPTREEVDRWLRDLRDLPELGVWIPVAVPRTARGWRPSQGA